MSAALASRPMWTLARGVWVDNRRGFCLLAATVVGSALALRFAAAAHPGHAVVQAVTICAMNLSVLLTFMLCGFTEADRQERRSGFPARLFVLPVPTATLIFAPMLAGAATAVVVHVVWASLAPVTMLHSPPLRFAVPYVATGMLCYHAMVWGLAPYRVLRLVALSFAGTAFFVSWIVLFEPAWQVSIGGSLISVQGIIVAAMPVLAIGALGVAYVAVDGQRHGGGVGSISWSRLAGRLADALPRSQVRFRSPAAAQFWLEWRRHGMLLPLCITAVFVLTMLPMPLAAPLGAGSTGLLFECFMAGPLLLAFGLGQGLGKADIWSKEPGLPLFLATRPLAHTAWIGAKLKSAAVASALTWLIVMALLGVWVSQWANGQLLDTILRRMAAWYSPPVQVAAPILTLGVYIVVTWRFLISGLWIGLAGRGWLLVAATCHVFFMVCAVPGLVVIATQRPDIMHRLTNWPAWTPWLLLAVFVAKAIGAILVARFARRQGWLSSQAIRRYLAAWCGTTGFLVVAAWLLVPFSDWRRWLGVSIALLAMPLLRMAYAPIALARNRVR